MNDYELTQEGINLLGYTWRDGDHLNVRLETGVTINFHAEAKCATSPTPLECSPIMVNAANSLGKSKILWSDLGIGDGDCIEWLQFSQSNYHYGEQGEKDYCLSTPPKDPPPDLPETGADPTTGIVLAVALLIAGISLWQRGRYQRLLRARHR